MGSMNSTRGPKRPKGLAAWVCCFLLALLGLPGAHAANLPVAMSSPTRIAPMQDTRLLVSDYAARLIHIVDQRTVTVERSFRVAGAPVAVAWGLDRIFVGNETQGQVEVYNPRGKLIGVFGAAGSIRLPNAIAVNSAAGLVYVLDAFEKVVKIFSAADGTLLGSLTAPGALLAPTAMTFDAARGLVIVSDFGSFSDSTFTKPSAVIHHFDLSGNELLAFNGIIPGTATRTFVRPQGLTVEGGRLFVVDGLRSEVHVLDSETGVPVGVIGSFGSGVGELSLPLDIVFSALTGRLYVTDNGNRRITSFLLGGAP